MKIDLIIGSLRGGGAERVVCTLANYYAEKGHVVRVITFMKGDQYELHEGVKRIRIYKRLKLFDFALVKAFLFLLKFYRKKKNRPDVISSHIYLMGLATIPISKLYGIKLVVSEHNNHLATKMTVLKWVLWNILYKFPDAVTILTPFDEEYFRKKNRNVIVMPNPSSFKPFIDSQRQREKTILAIGSLNRYKVKGFDTLLDIAVRIKEKHADWKFMIVGGGESGLPILLKRREELGLEDNVILSGYRSDIPQIMRKSEIFLLPSRFEGLPMVLMEAASQGMACIAFNCVSGPSEIIENGKTGILVDDQNKDQMTEKIIQVIENSDFRALLGLNAAKSSTKFALEKIGRDWENLFEKITSRQETAR